MVGTIQVRFGFQILALGFFVYQMNQSIQKYIDSPISIIKTNNKEMTSEPILFLCQPGQFNYNLSKSFGYKWMVHLWSGIFALADDKKATWKGKDGNKSFGTLIEELYNYDYSLVNLTHGKLGNDLFSINLGMCKELIELQYNKLPLLETSKKVFLIAGDPFTQTDLWINFDENAFVTTGNLENDLYEGKSVKVEYSITDQAILDGVECRNYGRYNSSYGQCVMQFLQVII